MEKRDIYQLHLLKSFNLPLSYSSYSNLHLALSWAWNIKVSLICDIGWPPQSPDLNIIEIYGMDLKKE